MTDITEFEDKDIVCSDCGNTFTYWAGEHQYFYTKGLSEPKRCKACRVLRRRNTSLDIGARKGEGQCECPSPQLPVVWDYKESNISIVTNICTFCNLPILPRIERGEE